MFCFSKPVPTVEPFMYILFQKLHMDQSNVIVFIRAYWPRDYNFDHVTFYCGGQNTSAQCNGHWAEPTFMWEKIISNDILAQYIE